MSNDNPTPPIIVLAAGSLRNAFGAIIDAFRRDTNILVEADYGPAGLLRERIEQGAYFDLFASANMDHPRNLQEKGIAGPVMRFARNRLCIIAERDLGVTRENLLDVMLDPSVKLGTSTPHADPSGDYALEFFARANALRPGIGDDLAAKALQLVSGPDSPAIPTGISAAGWLISQGKADLFISYSSNGILASHDSDLIVVDLPDALNPTAEYGFTSNPAASQGARVFGEFLLAEISQMILKNHGFIEK
ncbi:molybdate ABC transporter substrate-binding protein [Candidatus Phyllobacterium onerii]|uniref:molybdate ABC transporter substrate-binding protein n=1 Tax=Candidatus Phyllobacterium onerii TaxID=3020828 RepID=UPI00233000BA|nr:molybdate ABC transporter substrate-binding protein [Phyllobacterium sp. IY22]